MGRLLAIYLNYEGILQKANALLLTWKGYANMEGAK